jgi:hypothetical protein
MACEAAQNSLRKIKAVSRAHRYEDGQSNKELAMRRKLLSKFAVAIFASLSLAACVESRAPIITDAEPLLGQQFGVHLYEEFADKRAGDVHSSAYWWKDGQYVRTYGLARDAKQFVAQPLEGDDFLLQSSNDGQGTYHYWLARKLHTGVYLIFDLDETALDEATRRSVCGTNGIDGICLITTREQLLTVARATAAGPRKPAALGVIVGKPPAF